MPYANDAQRKAVWASRNERKEKRSSNKMRAGFKMPNSPFPVRKSKKGLALKRWFKEDWRTPEGKKDYSEGGNTFRPTKRISKDTPHTWSELTPAEKARAQKEKNTKGRVSRYRKKEKNKS